MKGIFLNGCFAALVFGYAVSTAEAQFGRVPIIRPYTPPPTFTGPLGAVGASQTFTMPDNSLSNFKLESTLSNPNIYSPQPTKSLNNSGRQSSRNYSSSSPKRTTSPARSTSTKKPVAVSPPPKPPEPITQEDGGSEEDDEDEDGLPWWVWGLGIFVGVGLLGTVAEEMGW